MAFFHQFPAVGFSEGYWSEWVPLKSLTLTARLKAQSYGLFSPVPRGRILRSLLERMGHCTSADPSGAAHAEGGRRMYM